MPTPKYARSTCIFSTFENPVTRNVGFDHRKIEHLSNSDILGSQHLDISIFSARTRIFPAVIETYVRSSWVLKGDWLASSKVVQPFARNFLSKMARWKPYQTMILLADVPVLHFFSVHPPLPVPVYGPWGPMKERGACRHVIWSGGARNSTGIHTNHCYLNHGDPLQTTPHRQRLVAWPLYHVLHTSCGSSGAPRDVQLGIVQGRV